MAQTPATLTPLAAEAASPGWFGALFPTLNGLLAKRTRVGKAVLTVLVLNEIRGVIVVITALAYWKARHG